MDRREIVWNWNGVHSRVMSLLRDKAVDNTRTHASACACTRTHTHTLGSRELMLDLESKRERVHVRQTQTQTHPYCCLAAWWSSRSPLILLCSVYLFAHCCRGRIELMCLQRVTRLKFSASQTSRTVESSAYLLMSPRLASKATMLDEIHRMREGFWISRHTHGQTWTSELEEKKFLIKTSHAKAASYVLRAGKKEKAKKWGSGSRRHWWKFPPAVAARAHPSDRPCTASWPCQCNEDAWCDLTCNASLNLHEWYKWSGPVADVSKLFYKDKSARGHSRVRIFIKVIRGDAVTGRRAALPTHNHERSLLLLCCYQAAISVKCKEGEDLNERKRRIAVVGSGTSTEIRYLPSDTLLPPETYSKPLTHKCKWLWGNPEWISV